LSTVGLMAMAKSANTLLFPKVVLGGMIVGWSARLGAYL